jgi:hypothetical protein
MARIGAFVRPLAWPLLLGLLSPALANACIVQTRFPLNDIRRADAIVVASVQRYEIIEYQDEYGVDHRYGLISADVQKSLKGQMSGKLTLIWLNSTFELPPGLSLTDPALIAIETQNSQVGIPRGNSLPFKTYPPLVLDSYCGGEFILPFSPKMEAAIRTILSDPTVDLSEESTDELLYGAAGEFREIPAAHRREKQFGPAQVGAGTMLTATLVVIAMIWSRKRRRRTATRSG